jgi:hypothetical protein
VELRQLDGFQGVIVSLAGGDGQAGPCVTVAAGSAQDQKVKPVGSGLRANCVPGVLHGAAEPFLAPQELLLGEAAHDGVGAAEVVRLVEELGKAGQCLGDLLKRVAAESCGGERPAGLPGGGIGSDRPGGLGKEIPGKGVRRVRPCPEIPGGSARGRQDAADLACGSFEVGDVVDDERQRCAVRRVVWQREGAGMSAEHLDARAARDLGSHCRRRLDREDSEVEPVAERGGERAGPRPMSTTVMPGAGRRCRWTASRHAPSPSRGTSRTALYAAAVWSS